MQKSYWCDVFVANLRAPQTPPQADIDTKQAEAVQKTASRHRCNRIRNTLVFGDLFITGRE
jgi:hypothetical protein